MKNYRYSILDSNGIYFAKGSVRATLEVLNFSLKFFIEEICVNALAFAVIVIV